MKFEFDSVNTLIKPVLVPVICYNALVGLTGYFVTQSWILGLSSVIGCLFSYIGFRQLIETQQLLLKKQNKSVVFIRFLFRLFIYATPILIAFKNPDKLSIPILIISLFTFQFSYIIIELIKNYFLYKKRLSDE